MIGYLFKTLPSHVLAGTRFTLAVDAAAARYVIRLQDEARGKSTP